MFVLIKNVHLVVKINGVWCFTVPWFVYEDIQYIQSDCHVIWWTSHSSCAFSIVLCSVMVMIYLLTGIGLPPGGSSTVHI